MRGEPPTACPSPPNVATHAAAALPEIERMRHARPDVAVRCGWIGFAEILTLIPVSAVSSSDRDVHVESRTSSRRCSLASPAASAQTALRKGSSLRCRETGGSR
jgi:hypothetical protein